MVTKVDHEAMRKINKRMVLDIIRTRGVVPRFEIAQTLKLSKATVSDIINQLIEDNIVQEIGEGESRRRGGRKPILLTLNQESRFIVGLDIGTGNIVVTIANLKGDSLIINRKPTATNHSVKNIVDQSVDLVNSIIKAASITRDQVLGIGVAVSGTVNKEEGTIEHSYAFRFKNVALADLIRNATNIETVINNCTRVMTLGELWYGKGNEIRNLFYINIGNGIGSAMVINGRIFNHHSEFGHVAITTRRIPCNCGNFGCLEAVASGSAIARQANSLFQSRGKSRITAKQLCEMANKGDADAIKIFRDAGKYIGRASSIVSNTFNPERIIIGGGVSLSGDLLIKPILEEFYKHTRGDFAMNTEILVSSFGLDAGVRGAVALGIDELVFK